MLALPKVKKLLPKVDEGDYDIMTENSFTEQQKQKYLSKILPKITYFKFFEPPTKYLGNFRVTIANYVMEEDTIKYQIIFYDIERKK